MSNKPLSPLPFLLHVKKPRGKESWHVHMCTFMRAYSCVCLHMQMCACTICVHKGGECHWPIKQTTLFLNGLLHFNMCLHGHCRASIYGKLYWNLSQSKSLWCIIKRIIQNHQPGLVTCTFYLIVPYNMAATLCDLSSFKLIFNQV